MTKSIRDPCAEPVVRLGEMGRAGVFAGLLSPVSPDWPGGGHLSPLLKARRRCLGGDRCSCHRAPAREVCCCFLRAWFAALCCAVPSAALNRPGARSRRSFRSGSREKLGSRSAEALRQRIRAVARHGRCAAARFRQEIRSTCRPERRVAGMMVTGAMIARKRKAFCSVCAVPKMS